MSDVKKAALFGEKNPLTLLADLWRWVFERHRIESTRIEEAVPMLPPAPIQATFGTRALQLDGEGALYQRRYAVSMTGVGLSPPALIRSVGLNFAALSPSALADFEKTKGVPWQLKVGDEFDITMLGPWNGAVRVVDVGENSFTFATLVGHPEAGTIQFCALQPQAGQIEFEIRSSARSRDTIVDIAYQNGGHEVQLAAWASFLEAVIKMAGGIQQGEIRSLIQVVGRD